jgi:hypothetical protein
MAIVVISPRAHRRRGTNQRLYRAAFKIGSRTQQEGKAKAMANEAVPVARRFLEAEFNLNAEGMIAELADDVVLEFPNAFEGMGSKYEGKTVGSDRHCA